MALGTGMINSKLDYTVGWEPSDRDDLVLWLKNDTDVAATLWRSQTTDATEFEQFTINRAPSVVLNQRDQEVTRDLYFDGSDKLVISGGEVLNVEGAFTFVFVWLPEASTDSTLLSGPSGGSANGINTLRGPHSGGGGANSIKVVMNSEISIFQHGKPFIPDEGEIKLQYYIIQRADNYNMTGESSVWGNVTTVLNQNNENDLTIHTLGLGIDATIKEVFIFHDILDSTGYDQMHEYLKDKFGIERYIS